MSLTIGIILLAITLLMCYQESKMRKINFIFALLICIIITPLIGYLVLSTFALRNPRGCDWCGNEKNEADFCGDCGKNAIGELFEGKSN